jgi:hypothetical protein
MSGTVAIGGFSKPSSLNQLLVNSDGIANSLKLIKNAT